MLAVSIRPVEASDVGVFYEHQADAGASAMAAFPSRDRAAHHAHWQRIMNAGNGLMRTVVVDGTVAGNVVAWHDDTEDRWLIGYWIGREFWGRGVATEALRLFLARSDVRPFYAHVAEANRGSQRVLEKNGFVRVAGETELGGDGIVELLYVLA